MQVRFLMAFNKNNFHERLRNAKVTKFVDEWDELFHKHLPGWRECVSSTLIKVWNEYIIICMSIDLNLKKNYFCNQSSIAI